MVEATKCEGNLTKKYTFTYDANGNLTHECFRKQAEVVYQYDTENRLTAVYDQQKLLVASTYDSDGNRAFQLNYNPEATCGYGMNVSGESFMPEHSQNEDESLTAEGQLFSYICSKTGRAYDLTEYVNDINRQYVETLTAYTINSGATESYSYAGNQRLSRNNIWDEAQGVRCNQTSYYLYDGLGSTKHTDFYGYNAERYNPNSGLEFLRARYYNANQGRFFQEDTYLGDIIDPLTLNRYAYGKNSPMNYVDPSGHSAAAIAEAGLGAGGYIAMLDGPIPGYADLGGAIVAGGALIVAGGVYIVEKTDQAIEEAYKAAEKNDPIQYSWQNGVEHSRQFFERVWNNRNVQFWFDHTTNQIDSAWPK